MMVSRVDFYLLAPAKVDNRLTTACRLIEKAYAAGHQVFVLLPTAEQVAQMDTLLWTFRDISFVPHAHSTSDSSAPVMLGQNIPAEHTFQVLVNLTQAIAEGYASFQRIIEIISSDEQQRNQGRELYKRYRELGCDMHTHTLEK
jgi:DNA polymerase-3 subunit chi